MARARRPPAEPRINRDFAHRRRIYDVNGGRRVNRTIEHRADLSSGTVPETASAPTTSREQVRMVFAGLMLGMLAAR